MVHISKGLVFAALFFVVFKIHLKTRQLRERNYKQPVDVAAGLGRLFCSVKSENLTLFVHVVVRDKGEVLHFILKVWLFIFCCNLFMADVTCFNVNSLTAVLNRSLPRFLTQRLHNDRNVI